MVGGEYYGEEYLRLNKHNPPSDSFPDKIRFRVYSKFFSDSSFDTVALNLLNPSYIKFYEDERRPATLLDVVAIPIDQLSSDAFIYNLSANDIQSDLLLSPGTELFVAGFPLGWASSVLYPIWKRGTIASDPNLLAAGNSAFLIDATTRGGMSGSPVYYRGNTYPTKYSPMINTGRLNTFLVGIYRAQDTGGEIGVVLRLDKVFDKLNKITN